MQVPSFCYSKGVLENPAVLVFLVFGLILTTVFIFAVLGARKRQAALKAWAIHKKFEYSEEGPAHPVSRYPDFDFIQEGYNQSISHYCKGLYRNYPVEVFELFKWVGRPPGLKIRIRIGNHVPRRRRQMSRIYSVIMLESPHVLRPLVIRPENLFDKVAAVFGFDDIDFASEEFSKRFSVKSPDPEWARAVCHDQTIDYLLKMLPNETIVFAGNRLCLYSGKRYGAVEFSKALEVGAKLLDLLPEHLKQSHSRQRSSS